MENCQCFLLMVKMDELFKASKNSITDERMIISKAPKIILKSIFENAEIFNGDSWFQKQKTSVSQQLVQFQLISLILFDKALSNEAGKCTQTKAI